MKIRNAQSSDLKMLATMYRQLRVDALYPRTYESLNALEIKLDDLMRNFGWQATLLEEDHKILGYCLWQKRDDAIYIRQFWIARTLRREGYGRKFIELIKKYYWQNQRIKLEVLHQNRRAIAFWESLGFSMQALILEWED